MPSALIDGITTRYEVLGSGPPLLMFSPGGFDATLEKWSTLGVYGKTRMLQQLTPHYSCIVFDRRETGQSGGRLERITWSHYVAQGKGLLEEGPGITGTALLLSQASQIGQDDRFGAAIPDFSVRSERCAAAGLRLLASTLLSIQIAEVAENPPLVPSVADLPGDRE